MSGSERWVLGLASVGSVMVALDTLVVAAALTTIRADLGASAEGLEWTVNAYGLSFAMLLMTAAALGDRLGRRRMYAAGLALFTVASVACAMAANLPFLIAARAVQGVGAAMVMPLAIGLLGAAFPPERRARAIGVFSGLTGIAVLGGPLIGGAVTEGLSWQWIFWINVPIGVVAITLVLTKIPESTGPARRLDLVGAVLISLAVLGLVWGTVRGESAGWTSAEVLTGFAGGVVLLIAFGLWERRTKDAMVPLTFFRNRTFTAANAAGFFLTAALFSAVFFLSQYMQAVLGSAPVKAGLQLLPWTGTLFIVGPIAGRLVDRVGERSLVVIGLALQSAGMFWISRGAEHYWELILPLVITGCGVSLAMPAAQSAAMAALPPHAVGIASGVYSMTRQLGGAAGVAVLGSVFASAGGYTGNGFSRALAGGGVLSLLGAVAGLAIATRRTAEPNLANPAAAQAAGARAAQAAEAARAAEAKAVEGAR
ncbi:DHA2 family efflux MFS transporter permease subunit [Kribbella solani]|uniref:DHA2 family efflux MFS transporter permease subunit n=1 Tax=Kribbella solani TaxID=236067 RepID=UPI0029B064F0|nr:DHA2 family efflux MFS transporter permease subunit [Kribbella solani]MDX3005521.1 DHA2 family efflux MFS transporter permease subunit [Kribbella solani]